MNKKGIIKASAILFVILVITIIIFFSLFSSAVTQEVYSVGEGVKLSLGDCMNWCTIKIISPSQITSIKKVNQDFFLLKFEEPGKYNVDIKSSSRLKKLEFEVIEKDPEEIILFNFTNENKYKINSTLKFNLEGLGNYELNIVKPLGERISRLGSNDWFLFKLDKEGEYLLSLERGNNKTIYTFSTFLYKKEDLLQGKSEINKPVSWVKTVQENLIEIPNLNIIENLSLTKENGDVFTNYELININNKDYIQINEGLPLFESIKLEYFTESPKLEEKIISENKKEVIIFSPEGLHYENVVSYTSIPEKVSEASSIVVYWKEEDTYLGFKAKDTNNNSLLDYVEWIVPHLSNQTFEIIIITKAEHLSSNKTFISDVYNEVKEKDNLWSLIPAGDYLRIIFERNLTNQNDITIYAKSNELGDVEVYEKDSDVKIADFGLISNEGWYKILLTNLLGEQDTFDLKIKDGDIEFDYIVDPAALYNSTLGAPRCSTSASPCYASSSLLQCSDSQSGTSESNHPNTLDACIDSVLSGECHSDESIENITITDLNSSNFRTGDTVNVSFWAYCYDTSDRVALYYTNRTSSPGWQSVLTGTTTCPGAGYRQFSKTFVLNNSIGDHAVRAIILYDATITNPCPGSTTDYADQDDLVFVVDSSSGDSLPTVTLSSPSNNYVNSTSKYVNLLFNASVTDDKNLVNCSLWTNYSGTWSLNQTQTLNGITNVTNFTINSLTNKTFIWNIQCYDNASQSSFGSSNRTVTLSFSNTALYNSTIGAPRCSTSASPCYATSSLLNCADSQAGTSEPNQPNTIDTCIDSATSGNCHIDESIENITIADLNSSNFRAGDTINVSFWAYCYGTMDRVALYYTNSTSSVIWKNTLIGTTTCPGSGYRQFSKTFVLNNSIGDHAVRAIILYDATITNPCPGSTTDYADQDDLVFVVDSNNGGSSPIINQVQCEQGGSWRSCSEVDFGETITRVRTNCTTQSGYITNATFNLTNIPDGNTFFNEYATSNETTWWIYDNSDLIINDSGEFNLSTICTSNFSLSSSNSTNWNVSWGNLSINLINPTSNKNVNPNQFFNFTAMISCIGGECGNVNATLDPFGIWWDASYSKRKQINITGGLTTLTNFPVYLNISIEPEMQADIKDIRFVNGSCDTQQYITELNYEIENYTSTNAIVWVKMPSFVSGLNQICMYYENSQANSGQNKTGVWSNGYLGVWHLGESGSNPSVDSTNNSNNGTNSGASVISGIIGNAQNFEGSSRIIIPRSNTLEPTSAITVSAWIRRNGIQNSWAKPLWYGPNDDSPWGAYGFEFNDVSDSNIRWHIASTSNNTDTSIYTLSDSTWYFLTGTYDGANSRLFVNGQYTAIVSHTEGLGDYDVTNGLGIGDRFNAGQGFNGIIDEVTISNVNRSLDWINQSYQLVQNQNSRVVFGSEEIMGGSKGIIPMNSGTPFYTISRNPMNSVGTSCLSGLKSGDQCNVTWIVNATGSIGIPWTFFVYANTTNYLNYLNSSVESSRINITIGNLEPYATELLFPLNNSALTSIGEFNWSNTTDPTGDSLFYGIQISNTSDFSYLFFKNYSIPERSEPTGIIPSGISSEGTYFWRVFASDSFSNSSWSETRVFYYDLFSPIVTSISPANLTINTTSNTVNFQYNVTDLTNITNCSLIINESINDSTQNITRNSTMSFTLFLPNSYYSWRISCIDSVGRTSSSSLRFLNLSVSNNPPVAREIECEKNNSWYNCSSISFGDNITKVRVRCTDAENSIANATFNLTNIPDSSNYFYNITTYNFGDYWILNNTNKIINDSGEFRLVATCYDNESLSNSNFTSWNVSWGNFSISLINPSSNSYVMKNSFFNFKVNVTCINGECGNANVTLDPPNWWNESWSYRRNINIANSGSTTLTNFPVYINVAHNPKMQLDFHDLRFLNGSCDSSDYNLLNYEIENYTSTNAIVWVKMPSFVSGLNQICMYYNSTISSSGQNKTGVWSNGYLGVWHLGESGSNPRVDSTNNSNNGTNSGASVISGIIGNAQNFDGSSRIIMPRSNALEPTSAITVSAWIKRNGTQVDFAKPLWYGPNDDSPWGAYGFELDATSDSNLRWHVANTTVFSRTPTATINDDTWYFITGTYDEINARFFVNGQYSGIVSHTGGLGDYDSVDGLGISDRVDTGQAWIGSIDEVTISNVNRSLDWINQSYQLVQNQNSFVTFENEEKINKGVLSTNIGATPFYTTDYNPFNYSTNSCLSDMKSGKSCNLTWNVNATGQLNSVWEFFVLANNINYLNYFNVSSESSRINITIVSQLPPSIPNLYMPFNGSAYSSIPNLNWTNSTDFNGDKIYYILQVSNTSDFSYINFANYSIPETSNPTGKTPTGITTQGAYYWRVIATDLIANSSWSETRVFYYDTSAPNLTFINQTGEDNRIINNSQWLNKGENITFFVNISDISIDKVWVVVWQSAIGGVEKVKTLFTYLGGILWMAKVSTDQMWEGFYNYTIYTNDTLGSQVDYNSNFTVLSGNTTINLNPSSTDLVRNITLSGHINLSNSTNLVNHPINLWLNGQLLFLSNLTPIGNYDFSREIKDTSSAEFSRGISYNIEISENQNLILSNGQTYGNFTRILDAGAMVNWTNSSWIYSGASCSGVFSYQEGNSRDYDGTRDTYIDSGYPTTNYGLNSDILIDGSPTYIRGLLSFDNLIGRGFYQIPENSIINNANLTLEVSDTGNLVNVYEILENWTEEDVTYNQRLFGTSWSSVGLGNYPSRSLTIEDSFTAGSIGSYTINTTNSVNNWASGTNNNYGWVFDMPTSNGITIRSSEYTTSSQRPLLMVDYSASECTNVLVYIRASNDKSTWTSWQQVLNGNSINLLDGLYRYLEYKVELISVNSSLTPTLHEIMFNYTGVVTNSNGDFNYNFTNPSLFGNYPVGINTSFDTITINNSANLLVQTGVPPTIELISPSNNQWFNYGNLNLTYNTTDVNDDFAYSELIINGALNTTNLSNIINNAYNNFTINFTSGQYNWSVNITDNTGYEEATSQRTFYIDLIDPNVSLIYPENQSNFSVNELNFSFIAIDNMDTNITCSVVLDGINVLSGIGVDNNSITNVSSGNLKEGMHYWNVTCTDNAIRNFTSQTFNFYIFDTPPNITLISPINRYNDSDGNISFVFNATDNTGFINCSLIINDTYRIWNTSEILNLQNNEINAFNLFEGNYNWTVECFDLSATSYKPSIRNFTIDLLHPIINLNSPTNLGNSLVSDISFNFTVNDTIDPLLSCNLTINGVVRDSFSATPGILTNRIINDLTDGLKYWNVSCVDDVGHLNTSSTWSINVTEYPSIILNTQNNTKSNQSSINLTYTPSDNTNLSSCRLYLNGALNQSNSSAILNNQQNNFTINGLTSGIYSWYVDCSDYLGLSNYSLTRIFYIDNSPPQINLIYPVGEGVFSTNITFNFSVIDFIDTNLNCNLTIDSSVLDVNFTVNNASISSRIISGVSDGYHTWNIDCWDSVGNLNTSAISNFTRFTNPGVTLTSPANNTWFNTDSVTLVYIPEDDEGIINASLFINGLFNRTNSSPIINGMYNNISITNFADGSYYWNINITDPTGLTGRGDERRFYIDTHSPNLILNAPNGSLVENNNVTLNFTIFDNLASNINCTIFVDGEQESSEIYSNNSNIIKYSILSDGNHSWKVVCFDEALNYNYSSLINFTLEAPPNVTLNSPLNTTRTTNSSITFFYTPYDPIGLLNCSIYFNGVLNQTKTTFSIINNEQNNFTINGISEGIHNWTVGCFDSDSNEYLPSAWIFITDISPPLINLNSPTNNTGIDFNQNQVYFNWTAIDVLDNVLQCNLTIDGIVRVTNKWVSSNVSTSDYVLSSVLGQGEHSWNVTCWDQLKNTNTSELRKFNLTYPDFLVNNSYIFFNKSNPGENESIQITATINNLAGVNVNNVIVRFYNGDPDFGGTQINSDILVNLLMFNEANASVNWNPPMGNSQIFVIVDPPLATNGSFKELNESNNQASKNITVGSWQFIYGDISSSSQFKLANSDNEKLIIWNITDFDYANIYATDYDSVISWQDLKAIGKDSTGGDSSSDFLEIDSLLDMSSFSDSVYNLYTSSGTINEKQSFFCFKNLITDVPVINSTNNSNFKTGILWDSSGDIDDGEFDSIDKEELVFITSVNKKAQGAYGIYDYEFRVPAKLREYNLPDSTAASFYVEIS